MGHVSMSESIGEIVAIWNGVAIVILFDVSTDGESPMNMWKAAQAGLVQTAFELLADSISLTMLRIRGIRVLDLARGRRWYWSATFCRTFMLTSYAGLDGLFIRTLCHAQDFQ